MANWERKSSYLLREIVKFSTYTDCLQSAKTAKEQVYTEREKRECEKESENVVDDRLVDGPAIEVAA